MKKRFSYIIDTIKYHFCKNFKVEKSRIKWIIYNINPSTKIKISNSAIYHCTFTDMGNSNKIIINDNTSLSYSSIVVEGTGNSVVLDGCNGCVTIIIKGNNCSVSIGKGTTMEDLYIVCKGPDDAVIIGEDCMFAGCVEIWGSDTHRITDLDNNPINYSLPVKLENHIWVGKHAKILKNTTIGSGAVVGMCSVVTHNVPANSVVAGNPAKIIKQNIQWHRGYIGI